MTRLSWMAAGGALLGVYGVDLGRADACGCFSPPDPRVPVVQAGERIVFSMKDGTITTHVQIQYSGPAEEFGWLLPMPSVPEMELGTDELFTQLTSLTQPSYLLEREYRGNCSFDPSRITRNAFADGAAGGANAALPSAEGRDDGNPLVVQDSVGPFDFAVLKADSKQPMVAWLEGNGYFIPPNTDEVVDSYIKEGAFFLALKLRKGNDVGDIQPVVLKYKADEPMIPIILTSVAADPNMPVQVWVMGESRAIPKNYHHTLINDAQLDWVSSPPAQNYAEVITAAVDESPDNHSFVTEYAGSVDPMTDVLDYDDRFGDLDELKQIERPEDYVSYLFNNGYTYSIGASFGQLLFPAQLISILQRYIPAPAGVEGPDALASYYSNLRFQFDSIDPSTTFDPVSLTEEIEERIVAPTREAADLFKQNSYMTRLFTTLSPEEMTLDPVFSFNPDLPDVSNVHTGKLIYHCGFFGSGDKGPSGTPATLITENGWKIFLPNGTQETPELPDVVPASERTELLRESGEPDIVSSNFAVIAENVDQQTEERGCSVGDQQHGYISASLFVLALGMLFWAQRRSSVA